MLPHLLIPSVGYFYASLRKSYMPVLAYVDLYTLSSPTPASKPPPLYLHKGAMDM